ncbi:MAG: G8 domain-containing protein [Pseudomonadota bacterium]
MSSTHMHHNTANSHSTEHGSHDASAQKLVGSGSTTLANAIASQNSDSHGAAHTAHGGDAGLVADHSSLLDLFPRADASDTSVAINGGSWFDPKTWADGKVPADGQSVYIPEGIVVIYDDVSNARLNKVGVAGELHFAVDQDTKMVVDTLLTGPKSVLTMGVEENPVQAGVSLDIVIHRDNGAVGGADDPTELGRGIVTHGVTEIVGQDKADFLNVDVPPQAGDNQLVFSEMPMGWEVGDKLVVAGTKLVGNNSFQDEIVTIKSISQSAGSYIVELDQKLAYDHVPPKEADGNAFQVPVANYTRNITIQTETDGDQYLSDGKTTPIDERGHVMFMHNDDVVVKNAEFFELGRTDKSVRLDDEDNVAGRYALHFHRTGVDDIEDPAVAEGNAVWGSPGWGIVHHDANLNVISNAVFGVNGGAIIAEAGNETGIWANNITMQTTGKYTTFNSEHSGDPNHPAGRQQGLDDSFTQGVGFGFKSRMILTVDNVAVSSNGAGYSYWPMGKSGGSPSHIDPLASNFEAIYGYNPFFGGDEERPSEIPNRTFIGNTAMVGHLGFNTSADKKPSKTDIPTVIDNFTAWEVAQGFGGFYQRDYLVKDSYFYGLQGGWKGDLVNNPSGPNTTGIMSREFHELKLVNNTIENFDLGIWEASHNTREDYIHVILGNTFINVKKDQRLDVDNASTPDQYIINDNSADWADGLKVGHLEAKVNLGKSDLVMTEWFDRFEVVVNKTDTLGSMEMEFRSFKGRNGGADQKTWWKENAENQGFYVENGKYFLIIELVVSDRVTGSLGVIAVPIELAFVKSPSDLPAGSVNNGALPTGLFDFNMIDVREIGKEGNQLNPVDLSALDQDPPAPHDPGVHTPPEPHVKVETTTYEDGRVLETTYVGGEITEAKMTDGGNAYGWTHFVDTFDSNGQRDTREIVYDDGRTGSYDFNADGTLDYKEDDTADAYAWDTIEIAFASDGKTRVDVVTTYDDGRVIDADFDSNGTITKRTITDAQDAYAWEKQEVTFAGNGKDITSSSITYDNGITTEKDFGNDGLRNSQVTTDENDVRAWAERFVTFADDGKSRSDLVVSYDDGRVVDFEFDTDGDISARTTTDVDDAYIWAEKFVAFTEDGTQRSDLVIKYDDGRVLDIDYDTSGKIAKSVMIDTADAHEWASYTQNFDKNGNVLATVYVEDTPL